MGELRRQIYYIHPVVPVPRIENTARLAIYTLRGVWAVPASAADGSRSCRESEEAGRRRRPAAFARQRSSERAKRRRRKKTARLCGSSRRA
ncbi:hypothetical protein MRX96_041178 [Rhipicephalus microplus]